MCVCFAQTIDSTSDVTVPVRDNMVYAGFFFVIFILCTSFFLVALFVGVVYGTIRARTHAHTHRIFCSFFLSLGVHVLGLAVLRYIGSIGLRAAVICLSQIASFSSSCLVFFFSRPICSSP
jgi:hypothetical protein